MPDGLFTLSLGKVKKVICRAIEKMMGIKKISFMGFTWEDKLYGGVAILQKNNVPLENINLIEVIINQTAVAIQRRMSREELRKSEEKYRMLADNATDIVWVLDINTQKFTYISPAVEKIRGYTQKEALEIPFSKTLTPANYQLAIKDLTETLKQDSLNKIEHGRVRSYEFEEFHKNGSIVSTESNIRLLRDEKGKPFGIMGVTRDITGRKKAETELKISAEKWQTTFNAMTDIVSVISKDHVFLEINKAGCDSMGLKREEIIGRKCYELVHNIHNPINGCPCSIALKTKQEANTELFENGRYYLLSAWPIFDEKQEVVSFSHSVRDITERKLSEKVLFQSEEKFRSIFENVQDVYYDVALDGIILEVSPSIEILTKGLYKREDLIGKPMFDFYADVKDRVRLLQILHEMGSVSDFEIKLKNRDGSEVYCSITSKILFDESKMPVKIIGTMRDIDARKKIEKDLAESEKKYRVIAEKTTDVIWLMDLEGRSIFVTPSIEKFTGFTVEEYLMQTIEERFTPQSAEYGMGIFSRELQLCLSSTEYLGGFHTTLELEYICKNGGTKWGELLITPFYDELKNLIGIHGVTRDVTEHKLSEAKEKARIENIEALAKVVLEIVELPFEADFFETITNRLYELLPNSIILTNSFDNVKMMFRTEAIRGLGSFAEKVFSIMGGHPEKETYLIDDEALKILLKGKLEQADGGLYQLSMEQLPKTICHSIESMLGIKDCYGIGLVYNKKLLGSVIILNKLKKLEVEKELIEIYMSQISIVLERRNTEKDLRVSEERFRELFTQANDVIFTIDLDGNFKTYNAAAAKIIGLGPHDNPDVINMRDLLSEKELKKVMAKMTEKLDGSTRHTFYEVNIINLKGQKLDLELNSSIRYKDEKPFEIFAIGRDITERKQLSVQLKNNYENQYAISSILQLSHQDLTLKDILLKAFDYIFEISWLHIEKKGGLFLATEDNTLELFIDLNLSKEIQKTCKKIKFGDCICGKTALSKKVEYINPMNESHSVKYAGMKSHGHYCVPIIYSGKTIAVLNTYVPDGHCYKQEEADFLQMIANTLSGVIIRKQTEENLKQAHVGLEEKIIKRTDELAKANEDLKNDIIRRRIAEEQLLNAQQLNLATINAINEWVYMVDREMKLVMMNDNAVEALHELGGIRAENYRGRRIDQVLKFISEKELQEYETVFETGKEIFTNETTTINDQLFITETKKIPIFENDVVVHVVSTVYNITKLKQAEQEISRALEKEKELSSLKSRFLNVITHEFRNPLAGILSSVQLIERHGKKWNEEKISSAYKGIYGAIKYTNFLLDDVSLIGKDESGKLSFNPEILNIEEFSRQISNEIQVIFGTEIPVELEVNSDFGEVYADPSLLRHILTNLLSNAIKYSRKVGKVEFQIREYAKNQVEFVITDHGIGIPVMDMQYIAEPFHRAMNVEKIKGTGLGLTIVKRCIELHNGTFDINSQENVGTVIKVVIPFTK